MFFFQQEMLPNDNWKVCSVTWLGKHHDEVVIHPALPDWVGPLL